MAGILEKWLGIDVAGDDQPQPAVRIRRSALWAMLFYTALAVAVVTAIGFKGLDGVPPDPSLLILIIVTGTVTLAMIGWIIRNAAAVFTASFYTSSDLEEEARTTVYHGNSRSVLGDEQDIGQYGKHRTLNNFLRDLNEEYAKLEHRQRGGAAGGIAASFVKAPTATKQGAAPANTNNATPQADANKPAPTGDTAVPPPSSTAQGTTYLSQLEAHYAQLLQVRSLLRLNARNESFLGLLPLQVSLLSLFGITLALLLAQTQPLLAWSAVTSAKVKSAEFANTYPLLQGVFTPAKDNVLKGCMKDTKVAVIIKNVTIKDNVRQANLVTLNKECFNQDVIITKNDGTLSATQDNVLQESP